MWTKGLKSNLPSGCSRNIVACAAKINNQANLRLNDCVKGRSRPSPIGLSRSGGEPYALKDARTVRRGVHWLGFCLKSAQGIYTSDTWGHRAPTNRTFNFQTFQRELGSYPTGGIISPLLSNLVLHELDMYMERIIQEREIAGARAARACLAPQGLS